MSMPTPSGNKIAFLGDIHGNMNILRNARSLIPSDIPLVQVGDFGAGFVFIPKWVSPEENIWFIRGNHDSPDVCRAHPAWISDGSYADGIMYVGGAWSIDWRGRTPGVSWWFDEELSDQDMTIIKEAYGKVKPSIMVTHDLPAGFMTFALFDHKTNLYQHKTRTGEFLQELFEIHQPDFWVGGHWHMEVDLEWRGTKFAILDIDEAVIVDTATFEVETVNIDGLLA